jgi:glycerophosphoryl diester phosphodiesterase
MVQSELPIARIEDGFATLVLMLIYAHRGASADFPEMTESAYLGAVKQGADGFECDLRLTRDEVPVLWHNASMLERAGNRGLIAEMNFSEVQRAYPQVLTLDDFLDIAIAHSKGVLIETKHPVISGNRVEEILISKLHDRNVLEQIELSVMSFSWSAIEKVKRLDSAIPTTFLMHDRTPYLQAKFSSAPSIGPGISRVNKDRELISQLKKLGRTISVWTVDLAADIELCKELGVDILITNTPAQARTFL